jgi:hypothetical protein
MKKLIIKMSAGWRVARGFAAGAAFCVLGGTMPVASAQTVTVVEYYNRALDAYFMTGRSNEQALLDGLPADFSRTGMQFAATGATAAAASQVRVCRFYISIASPFVSSHFYGREGVDCEALRAQNPPGFSYEDYDFAVTSPDASGACAAATPIPVFRSFRAAANGRTSNHRYTTSRASYDGMTAAGWTPEQVAFCVTAATDATLAPAGSFKRVVSLPVSPFAPGCNVQATGTVYTGAEVEPHLATNPANSRHMVAAWQQDRWSTGAAQGLAGAVSFDGGLTWSNTLAAFSRCSGGTAASGTNYDRASDPWLSIGPDGTAFQMALAVTGTSFTQSSISAMLMARSADGGRTWGAPQTLVRDASANIFHDKNTVKADPKQAAFVYAVWGRLEANGHGPAWFTRSTNGGLSWETSRGIYDPGADNQTLGNGLDVLPDGTVINVFLDIIRTATPGNAVGQRVRMIRSTDSGATWSVPVTVSEYFGIGTIDPETAIKVRDSTGVPQVAVGSDGHIHVVWQDSRFNGGAYDGVAYSQSKDGGLTWSAPVRVNARADVAAFVPSVHVRSDGTIGVSYYDFRDNTFAPSTLPTTYRLAVSADGVNWRESEINAAFNLNTAPFANGIFLGDYQALSSNGSAFSALYARTTGLTTGNTTEIVFANLADGSLKRSGASYRAMSAEPDFTATPQLRARVRENLERAITARREKFRLFTQ